MIATSCRRAPLHARPARQARPARVGIPAAIALGCALMIGFALAYWSVGSAPGGNGASGATVVNPGETPFASVSGNDITVIWDASTLSNGDPVAGYLVRRYDLAAQSQTVLSACTGTVTALTCVEAGVPTGSWVYSVTPVVGTNWQGAESAMSNTVTTDSTPPANVITMSVLTGNALKTGTTIYYRGTVAGSFTLTNGVTDGETGPASSATAALGGTTTGWIHTPSTVSTPAGGPYVSNTFSWGAGTTSSPSEVVTGRDVAGNTVTTNLTFVDDSTGPTPGTVTYPNATQTTTTVSVSFTTGTDAGSGINTRLLQRASATFNGSTCGTFGSFATIANGTNPTSPVVDTVTAGMCHKYQYVVTDRVGNTHIASSANVVSVQSYGIFTANHDIGGPSIAGFSGHSAGTYTVAGSGADVWGSADQFQYLAMPVTGDVRLTARVASQTNTNTFAKAGVMFRQTLAAGSVHATMDVTPSSGAEHLYRSATNGSTVGSAQAGIAAPYWVRLTRVGDRYTAERSPDGITWTEQGMAQTISMGSTIYVGLMVTSHDNAALNTATFDNVTLTRAPTAIADSYSVNEDTTLNIAVAAGVLANDTDPDSNPLTAVLVSGTSGLTLNANGSFTYVPPANFSGVASFTYKANDGVLDSNTVTVNITVNAVNDAPSFTKGANQSITVSAGAQTVAGWATAISQGPGDSGQVLDFIVTNNDNSLFTAQPAVSATGTLTYTPGSSTGVATVSVRIHDNGGTANGGVDTSAIQTFTITVTPSNLGIFTANQDVGGPSIAGSSSYSAGTYTMSGSGADIWANPDQFQFLHVPMTGDGTLTARVVTDTNPNGAAKAGVMMRNTLTGGSVHALMNVTAANGTEFIARAVDGQSPSYATSTGGLFTPYWVRLTRLGNTFTAERSPDGITWTQQGTTQTIAMNSTIYVGLVVSSHTNAALHTATFDSVALSRNLFTANQDVGGPSIAGSSSYSNGTYTVSGSGADIWGNADQFQFNHVPMTGDGTLTARVVTDTNPHAYAKAGVMMRNTLTGGSAHALMDVMAAGGTEFLARTVDGQTTSGSTTGGLFAPYWVRLTRVGNTFTAERSPDGITWTQQGTSQTIAMNSTIYVGLAVSSHTNAALHTATFDNVTLSP